MDVKDLVDYAYCAQTSEYKVLGVREFHLGGALRDGNQDLLGQTLPSQWGDVGLFDLCLRFGHFDTAWAMAERGVEGCRLEAYHLKRDCHDRDIDWWGCGNCIDDWETCEQCCFGFPVEQGIWMTDWNSNLSNAAEAARRTAEQPLVRTVLEVLRSKAVPHALAISDEAMTHLLDIAVLIGDREAAVRCAERSRLRPLRRWSWEEIFRTYFDPCSDLETKMRLRSGFLELRDRGMLLAALSAGVELQGLQQLHVALTPLIILCRIPFRVAVALTGTPWTDFVDLLPPPDTPWVPPEENDFGEFFLKVDKRGEIGMPYLCKDLLEIAQTAQVPLAAMRLLVRHLDDFHLSLLDCAILFGQSDCAALLATEGVELSHEGSKLLLQFGVLDAEPARWPAAMAAAHAALSKVWKSEIAAKGIAIYQLMKKLSKGRPFPASLVDEVAAFSMDVPKIIEDLDLCQEASAWYKSSQVSPVSPVPPKAEKISVHPEDVKFSRGSREPDATSQSQRDRDAEAVDEKAMDALMMAMRESRGDVPALNVDGVRLFRLTRMANANHVVDLLFDRLGPLKALHDRVQEAGCSVNPEDNPLKILYVPCTEEQLLELQQLAADGFELRKDLHILALQEDAKLINQAFRELFQRLHVPRNCRPELKPEGPQHKDVGAERGSEAEDLSDPEDFESPMIEKEPGFAFRTDSDMGYPSYEG